MKVLTVTYRANRQLGNYRTRHVEMTAQVGKDETPEQALCKLKRVVHSELEKLETKPVCCHGCHRYECACTPF